jgi:hypothetical protein
MLGLTLRKEFQGKRLKGTAIELTNERRTGATQVPAKEFLEITYPSGDLLKALEAVGPAQGRPLVLLGERGQGKSHLMAALYHALTDADATQSWLRTWADRLGTPKVAEIPLRRGMHVVSESLHRHRYKFLWDILLDNHPDGQFIRGKWDGLGSNKTDVPPDRLIFELLEKKPTALILDEFQTWFDGLTNRTNQPLQTWAFNFIQILSEIAKEHPELLLLVVSVRNGATDAYQQMHRVNPVRVDFKGPGAEQDRRRLLLHRLFQNRLQVPATEIEALIAVHTQEFFRLGEVPLAEQDRKMREFIEMWPFAPHLMQLLEDQVLVATDAQETRDLIRILADVYKSDGETVPVLTAADFRLDDDGSGIAALLDSVANRHHASLREKAQRNISAVRDALSNPAGVVPHLSELIGALWLRSLAVANMAGAEPRTLQIDITRDTPIDDNAFQVELAAIKDNSFNIHEEGNRLIFREEENPQAKLMAFARNDRLFTDGSDHRQLAKEIRYVIGGAEEVSRRFRVIVLPQSWLSDPWTPLDESERPDRWDDRLPILVLPEEVDRINERLGDFLKQHLQKRRNTIRFLVPRPGSTNAFLDRDLLILSRAILKAQEWKPSNAEYGRLQIKYQNELRGMIKPRFDRVAVLRAWNFQDPARCQFHVESLKGQGGQIPATMEESISTDLFVPEDFEALVTTAAENNESLGKLLREFQEPRPNEQECVPWLGETAMKEKVLRLCARGRIAINIRGTEFLQAGPDEDEETAWRRMRSRLGVGKHLDETFLMKPDAAPRAGGTATEAGSDQPSRPETPAVADGGGHSGEITTPAAGGTIFDKPSGPTTPHSAAATSALNLLSRVEAWGIGPGTAVRNVRLRLESTTGAQLGKLLKSLPDGLTYELDLDKDEN